MNIRKHLEAHHVPYDLLDHPTTSTAVELSDVLDVDPDFVAKTVLLRTATEYVVAVLPASCMIDLKKAAQALHAGEVAVATEDEARRLFEDCESGIVPPFGSLYGLKTLVEHTLTADSRIVFAGNAHHLAYRVSFEDFRHIEHPIVARYAHFS